MVCFDPINLSYIEIELDDPTLSFEAFYFFLVLLVILTWGKYFSLKLPVSLSSTFKPVSSLVLKVNVKGI